MIELSEFDNELYNEICENKKRLLIDQKTSIIKGDISGIQNFITNISTEDALRNLRARSFYITILTDVLAYELVSRLGLGNGKDDILLSAGGHFFITSDNPNETIVDDIELEVNSWMLKKFGGVLGLVLEVGKNIEDVNKKVAMKKNNKFKRLIYNSKNNKNLYEQLFKFMPSDEGERKRCRTCKSVKSINEIFPIKSDYRYIEICEFCKSLMNWGKYLPSAKYVLMVHGNRDDFERVKHLTVPMPFDDSNKVRQVFIFDKDQCLLHSDDEEIKLDEISQNLSNLSLRRFVINEKETDFKTYLLGNLAAFKQENGRKQLLSLDEIVKLPKDMKNENRTGADLIGTLVMDVDGLGNIFKNINIEDSVKLSCHLDFFFKYLINKYQNKYQNLTLIYSGGDDLAIIGRWDAIIKFACEFRSEFDKWIEKINANNNKFNARAITISASCYIDKPKFPVESAMKLAKEALDEKAKKLDGKNAFCLFDVPLKWNNYLETGTESSKKGIQEIVELLTDMKENNKLSVSTIYKLYKIKNDFENCAVAFKPRLHYIIARDLNYRERDDNPKAELFRQTFMNLIKNPSDWDKLDLIVRYATLKIKEPAGE